MVLIQKFTEMIAWQKAHELTLRLYKLTEQYPKTEQFGLISQSRRCAVSIPSNLAEGFKRKSKADSLHFYNIAEVSLEELKYQLMLAHDLGYIADVNYNTVKMLTEDVGRLINAWKRSQK